tara:strand:- start:6023 stop:6733 length:711 start_codon:yes stop_codon:yes gene_type:complete
MRVLLMIISHNISKNNLNNIYDKIINPLKGDNIDVDIATCISGDHNIISNDVTYNFKFDGFQLAKVCYVVNNFNDEYEYYIKIRPEIILKTTINNNFLIKLSKSKINSRCRQYSGPPIDLTHGMSCQVNCIRTGDIQYNDKVVINPDDQMYIFHKSIKKAFSPITIDTYLNYCKTINDTRDYWVDEWMLDESYWKKTICEREGHHKFIWYSRGLDVNPIDLDIQMNGLISSNLVVK